MRGPVIAIDGPSGVGKTTVSKLVAKKLDFRYVDTGAMYRAVALGAVDEGVNIDDEGELKKFLSRADLSFGGGERILLNGRDYTKKIREPLSGELASRVSSKKAVREFLVRLQRRLGEQGRVVMEGRDIGTVVFPDADVKVFLDARAAVREKRRHGELSGYRFDEVAKGIEERDRRDRERVHSPLRPADDAVYVDTTDMGIEEVAERLLNIIKERFKRKNLGDTDC